MKKFGIFLIALLFLLTALYAFLQGPIAKEMLRNALIKNLHEAGIPATIGAVEGTLPDEIQLKNVQIESITIETLTLKPVLWRLLKKQIAFKNVSAKNISLYNSAPFDFEGSFWTGKTKAALKGKALGWKGNVSLNRLSKTVKFKAKKQNDSLKGKLHMDTSWRPTLANVSLHIDDFRANVELAQGKLTGIWSHDLLTGSLEAGFKNRTLQGRMIADNAGEMSVDWTFLPGELIQGSNLIEIQNLNPLLGHEIYGKAQAKMHWKAVGGQQHLELDVQSSDFYLSDLWLQKISLYSDLILPSFSTFPSGEFDLSIEKGAYLDHRIDSAHLTSTLNGPFTFFVEGKYLDPYEVKIEGKQMEPTWLRIDSLDGFAFKRDLSLAKAVDIQLNPEKLSVTQTELHLGDATFFALLQNGQMHVDATHFPLSLLAQSTPIAGEINVQLNATLEQGKWQATLMQTAPFQAEGVLSGTITPNRLTLQGDFESKEKPIASITADLPIRLFSQEVLWHEPAKASLWIDGQIGGALEFFFIGPHRFTGEAKGRLAFSNTLYRPLVEGHLKVTNGTYENDYTAGFLKEITAELFAEKNNLYLRSLTASSQEENSSLNATGRLSLLASESYPYFFDLDFNDLSFSQMDLIQINADGKIHLEGNRFAGHAKGKVELTECTLSIPDHIPNTPPKLEVVYKNKSAPVITPTGKSHYPIYLDLEVSVPSMTIAGRGLDSEWSGQFHVGGEAKAIATQGDLNLIDGEFVLSSKRFSLDKGHLSFSGIEGEMPTIHLEGNTEAADTQITAILSGPLDKAQVSLRSNPPLPLSSIMSRLLFGSDVAELTGFQALELANSLSELSGSSPGVMESTRRALGVDRLRIYSTDSQDGERVSLEVGKYVTDNVLVTLTQEIGESEPNISIEVALKSNLIFQLESDQRQEQGKFTLKWKVSY